MIYLVLKIDFAFNHCSKWDVSYFKVKKSRQRTMCCFISEVI